MKLSQAQIDHIRSLEDLAGRLTAEQVLVDAKKKTSPLHELFDWNKDKAAHHWWLNRAREIIGAVRIEVHLRTTTIKAPHYIRDPDVGTAQGYRAVTSFDRGSVSARQALHDELARAAGTIERARHFALALNLDDELDAMLEQVLGLKSRLEVPAA